MGRGVLEGSRRTHHLVLDAMPAPEAWCDALPPNAKEIVGVHLYNDLSDADFESAMGMEKEAFYQLKQWKQRDLKKRAGLF